MTTLASTSQRAYQIDRLTSTNYEQWSIQPEVVLLKNEQWGLTSGTEVKPADITLQSAWDSKDSKARCEILLHCSPAQLQWVRSLKTSKEVWDLLKATYAKTNKGSQVSLHKKLINLTLSETSNVISFLEEWQFLVSEASLSGLKLSNDQQVILLLAALSPSWRAFISTQGSITNLTLADLISSILQEHSLMHSNDVSTKSVAFYTKNKNYARSRPQFHLSNNKSNNNASSFKNTTDFKSQIICHYCGKLNHKSPE